MDLRQALDDCSAGLLLRIARRHGLAPSEAAVRGELISAIEARFAEPGHLDRYLLGLPPLHHQLLELVAAAGGEARGFELERRVRHWQRSGPNLPSPTPTDPADPTPEPPAPSAEPRDHIPDDSPGRPETRHERPETRDQRLEPSRAPLVDLLQHGLLFRTFVSTGLHRGEVYCLPDEVRGHVEVHPEAVAASSRPEPAESAGPVWRCDPAFDLFLLAGYLRRGGGERVGQVHAEIGEVGHQVAGLSSRDRWRFVVAVTRQGGFFERSGARLLPAEAVHELLERRDAAVGRLWEAYLGCDDWNEVVESGLSSSPLMGRLREPGEWRTQVLDLLQRLDPDRWYPVDGVIDFIRRATPDLLREHYESASASLLEPRTGTVLQGPESWALVEAPLLRYLLAGPLYWLGVVGWSTDPGGRDLVALTEPGRALVSGAPQPLVAPLEPAQLERDGSLRFPAGGNLAAMHRLEPYLRLLRHGDPSEYRLDAASFCDGLAAGGSLEQALSLLAEVCGARLSDRARHTLTGWAEEYGRVSIGPALLLTVGDEQLGSSLLDDPELAPLLRARLGPAAARLSASQVEPLARRLRAMGYYPQVDAAVRLMAGRGAYAGLIDERVLEWLLVSLEALRRLAPSTLSDLEEATELRHRLQAALGSERTRRLQSLARKTVRESRRRTEQTGGGP